MRWFVALVLAVAAPAIAQDTMPPAPYAYQQLANPQLEAKAEGLMGTLRCLTCQGQSIADSDASMAGDMRSEIRQRIAAGESPEHIRQWLIGRYGEYISYKPQVTRTTWPLFVVPVLLLLLAVLIAARRLRRRA
ncbi:MAG TPA: cytochrome c-type biogenesis protein [Croceibacterium sp.]|jgi:cytochrome c-type biogenesis protein CcmH